MLVLGGFFYGSAVILWALICPMAAMLFDEPRNAPRWFARFVILTLLCASVQSRLSIDPPISSEFITFFFAINLIGVGSLIFFLVLYFVGQKNFFAEQSEGLLLNILPKEIARNLKKRPSPDCRPI